MKPLICVLLSTLPLTAFAAQVRDHLGLQLYSLRAQFKDMGVARTLDLA
jgi:hypothetical protein